MLYKAILKLVLLPAIILSLPGCSPVTDENYDIDDGILWVDTWNDGMARVFDISDPFSPKETYTEKIGAQINMTSQSWDGKRIYFTSSLLSNWDKKQAESGDIQYLKAYDWDGKKLSHKFSIDFIAEKLGLPHQMRFGSYALYGKRPPTAGDIKVTAAQ